jgi:hypothetical protein
MNDEEAGEKDNALSRKKSKLRDRNIYSQGKIAA